MFYKFTILLCALFVGCSAPQPNAPRITAAAPTSANIFTPQAITTTPQPQETAVSSPENALDVFPLKRGAQWVYREIAYDTIPNDILPQRTNRQITATLLMTDTIVDTQSRNGNYAAQVVRERTVVSTTIDLADMGDYGDVLFANNAPPMKWYVFAADNIYSQLQDLDWNAVETSTLELKLPLVAGERWYPDAEQRAQFSIDELIPGLRVVERAPLLNLPAGDFADCFILHDFYNGGGILTEFCPGIGVVGTHFDHAGTPFGSHTELLKFNPGK